MSASAKQKETIGQPEQHTFGAEISKVLQLMIHSLYTNKDIFLRELISNASDACDKLRYEAVSNDSLLADDSELRISLAVDEEAKTLTLTDNGIGMNRDDLIAHLGTIAKSGTQEFFGQLTGDAQKDSHLIGQFGVGFYSAYMVANHVTVRSCKAGENEAWQWESSGDGSFTLQAVEEDFPRGTAITLQLKEDASEYLDRFKLKHIISTYSDHIGFPITLLGKDDEADEVVNSASALWARPKSEITEEQYQEFYRHVAHQPDTPFLTLHNQIEGAVSYSSLLYVPSMKPFDLFHPDRKSRVKLYIKRVFITEESVELVPAWLRFLRGVIDSEDLPLNISRETLQHNATMTKIRDAITKKILNELKRSAAKDEAAYAEFWKNFGAVLKEGLCEATAPTALLLETCRFTSTHTIDDATTSLAAYKERMKEGQEAIYFLSGDNAEMLRQSPQLEGFKKQGIEVILLTDHVDDFWVNVVQDYDGTPLRSAMKFGSDLDKFSGEEENTEGAKSETESAALDALIAFMKETLGDKVKQVRTTKKLADSPVCLAVGEGDMDLRMEQFLVEQKQLPGGHARILEVNPDHPIIQGLVAQLDAGDADGDLVELLYDQANIAEGQSIADPIAYVKRVNALLAAQLNAG